MHSPHPSPGFCRLVAAAAAVATAEDGVARRARPAAVVAVAAPLVTAVVVPTLAADVTAQLAPVPAHVAALVARVRAVGAIGAPLLTNLPPILAQPPRLVSRELTRADAAPDSVIAPLPERVRRQPERHAERAY